MIKYFFLLLIVINKTNLEKNINPILLIEDSYPFILSSEDDDYYYIICSENNLKIEKESGTIENRNNNDFNLSTFIFISDKIRNNYIYFSNKYYYINYSSFVSFNEVQINFKEMRSSNSDKFTIVGSISIKNEDDFIIYGYKKSSLIFCIKSQSFCPSYTEDSNLSDKLTCKFINGTDFVCAIYINSKLIISCFKYELSSDNNNQMNSLNKYSKINPITYDSISIFGLYDTEKDNIKILCQKTNYYTIECNFLK